MVRLRVLQSVGLLPIYDGTSESNQSQDKDDDVAARQVDRGVSWRSDVLETEATQEAQGGDASPSDLMIRTVDLRVDYGNLTAVKELDLHVPYGEIFGLLGPNGSGKSSTFRVLGTLQEPTYGDVYVAGIDIAESPHEVHKILGFMPDLPVVYDELKCWEFLDAFASAYFLGDAAARKKRIDACLELTNLTAKRDALSGSLSRGMKQRLLFAKTLLHQPDLLILDEPAGGLDPIGRVELRNVIREQAKMGKTILISSHILTELDDFCTSIGILEKGRLVIDGKIADIRAHLAPHKRWVIELLKEDERAVSCIRSCIEVERLEVDGPVIEVDFDGTDDEAADLLAHLIGEKIRVKAFYEQEADVEDIFLQIGAREVV
jgi:ABC-2 type transport system ATP-binding protein